MAHRYLFVGGVHRSGTSLVARLAAGISGVSAITDAPVPENEGAYLQGAIPHTACHGIPGAFATDPAQHLLEGHPLDRLSTRVRMEADWDPWFDPAARWRVEKSPVNLTRMRLYQQLFPLSQFVVVVRHPAAVAAAMGKWVDTPQADLVAYWQAAHATVLDDLTYLHAALILRYEDVVADPGSAVAAMAAFIDAGVPGTLPDVRDGNRDYPGIATVPVGDGAAARLGYGDYGAINRPDLPMVRHPLRATVDAVMVNLNGNTFENFDFPAAGSN